MRSKIRRVALPFYAALVALALAVPLSTTLSAETCCTQCSCMNLCCTIDVCGPDGGTVSCTDGGCSVNCRVYSPISFSCSQYC